MMPIPYLMSYIYRIYSVARQCSRCFEYLDSPLGIETLQTPQWSHDLNLQLVYVLLYDFNSYLPERKGWKSATHPDVMRNGSGFYRYRTQEQRIGSIQCSLLGRSQRVAVVHELLLQCYAQTKHNRDRLRVPILDCFHTENPKVSALSLAHRNFTFSKYLLGNY